MAMRSHDEGVINDINITPFVDVLLVLLIIFMVAAPAMTRSVGVELPKEQATEEKKSDKKDEIPVVIGLDKTGKIIFQKKSFELQHFFDRFSDLTQDLKIEKIFIQADKSAKYENLLKLMVFLKNKGHGNLGFVFEQK